MLIIIIGIISLLCGFYFLTEYVLRKIVRNDIKRIHNKYKNEFDRDATIQEIYDNAIYPIEYYEKEILK